MLFATSVTLEAHNHKHHLKQAGLYTDTHTWESEQPKNSHHAFQLECSRMRGALRASAFFPIYPTSGLSTFETKKGQEMRIFHL